MANISDAIKKDIMSLNDLFKFSPNRPPAVPVTKQREDMDADEAIDADRLESMGRTSSVSVEEWFKMTLTVKDDPKNNRFLVRLGRLVFPIGYDLLANETGRMLAEDNEAEKDITEDVMMTPQDLKAEAAAKKQKQLDDARAELAKPLKVKRSLIEKGYEPKT